MGGVVLWSEWFNCWKAGLTGGVVLWYYGKVVLWFNYLIVPSEETAYSGIGLSHRMMLMVFWCSGIMELWSEWWKCQIVCLIVFAIT